VDAARYVRLIGAGRPDLALRVVYERIPFPSACGLVCFHPCESHCRRRLLDEAVSVRALKRFAVEHGGSVDLALGTAPLSGKKVAVIGAGPAGLTAAYYLRKKGGHKVTIFEMLGKAGGMLRYGIPDYRLPQDVLDKEIQTLLSPGDIELKTNTKAPAPAELLKQGYDAVFVAVGAHEGMKLKIEGEDGPGVEDCVTFLRRVNAGDKVDFTGKKVGIVGGGNAAVDAARVSWRLGADAVTMIYRRTRAEMPAYGDELHEAEIEGIKFEYLTVPTKIERQSGKLIVTSIRFQLGPADESGRPRPIPIEGSDFTGEYDYLIMSIGQRPGTSDLGLEMDRGDTIKVERKTLETSIPGVYAGGDAVTGPASVIEAIGHGRSAASAIDKFLGGKGEIAEDFTPEPFTAFPEIPAESADWQRTESRVKGVKERVRNFTQVEDGFSIEEAIREAGRCLRCDLELEAENQ
jgi:NADPH-dependent glutamate synthase beta subunit-like oxidoreductase